jgi:hypothetical protein
MDKDEMHGDLKPTPCLFGKHNWEIILDDDGDETTSEYRGTQAEAVTEMESIFDDFFDGGITSEGYPPCDPSLLAHCSLHDITINLVRDSY